MSYLIEQQNSISLINDNNESLSLLSLSNHVILLIITELLALHDVSRIDCAYTNKSKREELLYILSACRFNHIRFDNRCIFVDYALIWIGSRKITISSLSVGD